MILKVRDHTFNSSTAKHRLKIALVFNSYGPYHLARLNGFYRQVQSNGWEVVGIEFSRSETEYPWQTEVERFPVPVYSVISDCPLEHVNFLRLLSGLYQLLSQVNPDVVAIAGYARPSILATLAWCRWQQKQTILFSETTEHDFHRLQWREWLKGWIVSQYNAGLVGGTPHKRYLSKLGMPEEAIFLGYDVVEIAVFHPNAIHHLPRPIVSPYFLTINRFVPKKNLLFLLDAYSDYCQRQGSSAWALVLCGDGPLRTQIEQRICDLNLGDRVHLTGFLQQADLLPYFAHASCFVHASIQEQWGLVVNEAMAAGLPVLVSNRCGCAEDLIVEGVNGFCFDPTNPLELTQLMLKISSEDVDLQAIGQAALHHIQQFSPDYFAQGLIQAVEYVWQHHCDRPR